MTVRVVPEADATPDEAFDLGVISGRREALADLRKLVDEKQHWNECGWDVASIDIIDFIDGEWLAAPEPADIEVEK